MSTYSSKNSPAHLLAFEAPTLIQKSINEDHNNYFTAPISLFEIKMDSH